MENPPDSQTQHTFCNGVDTFQRIWISFPYKLYTSTEGSCWNRRISRTVTGASGETQFSPEAGGTANTQTMKV